MIRTLAHTRTSTRVCLQTIALVILGSWFAYAETTFYGAYQTGLQMETSRRWQDARTHFQEAATLNPVPARRVRTYGLNFLHDYDPYIHLAICELHLGMLDEAAKHLEMSRKAHVAPLLRVAELRQELEQARRKQTAGAPQPPVGVKPPESAPPKEEKLAVVPTQGILKIESVPSGATVIIDGKELGVTPLAISLPAGSHEVQWQQTGYRTANDAVDIKVGETLSTRIVLTSVPAPAETKPPAEKRPETPTKQPEATSTSATQAPVAGGPQETAATSPAQQPAPKNGKATRADEPQKESSGEKNLRLPFRKSLLIGLMVVLAIVAFLLYRTRAPHTTTQTRHVSPPVMEATIALIEDTPAQKVGAETIAEPSLKTPHKTSTPVPELEEVLHRAQPLSDGAQREFGGYRLHGVLGRGGMGTTFLATRVRDRLPLAIKIPHEHLLDDQEFARRFLREGSLGSTLHHPNIIRLYEAGVVANKPFIAMELIQGETLESKLRKEGLLPIRMTLEIARDIALALDYARLKGIVHRDLKPENIMLLDRGGLKVMDYGIARIIGSPGLTATEAYLGTPAYSSPEATGGGDVDQQSDLYSLGILLYRMLAGEVPFRSKNVLEVLEMHRNKPLPAFPADLKIPDAVFTVVQKLTAKNKTERFTNAESFLIELNTILNQLV